jgi:hypothetical protein
MPQLAAMIGTITASSRVNLSIAHLLAAAMFSRAAGALESLNTGQPFGEFWMDIQANAIGAIFTSVAGLEAFANELFVDHATVFPDIRPEVMAKLWELYEQKRTLEKYEFALLLRHGNPFHAGRSTYQNIDVLIKLRNALTHFKPEWSDQAVEHAKLSKYLQPRIKPSPFFPKNEPLFPRAWAGHSSTQWAIRAVVSFILEFETSAKLPSRLQSYRQRLLV